MRHPTSKRAPHIQPIESQRFLSVQPLTLFCRIVLVGLTVALPDVTVEVIEVVGGDVGNAVQLEEVGPGGQSPECGQQPPPQHHGRGRCPAARARLNAASGSAPPIYSNRSVHWRPVPSRKRAPLPSEAGVRAFLLPPCGGINSARPPLQWGIGGMKCQCHATS